MLFKKLDLVELVSLSMVLTLLGKHPPGEIGKCYQNLYNYGGVDWIWEPSLVDVTLSLFIILKKLRGPVHFWICGNKRLKSISSSSTFILSFFNCFIKQGVKIQKKKKLFYTQIKASSWVASTHSTCSNHHILLLR